MATQPPNPRSNNNSTKTTSKKKKKKNNKKNKSNQLPIAGIKETTAEFNPAPPTSTPTADIKQAHLPQLPIDVTKQLIDALIGDTSSGHELFQAWLQKTLSNPDKVDQLTNLLEKINNDWDKFSLINEDKLRLLVITSINKVAEILNIMANSSQAVSPATIESALKFINQVHSLYDKNRFIKQSEAPQINFGELLTNLNRLINKSSGASDAKQTEMDNSTPKLELDLGKMLEVALGLHKRGYMRPANLSQLTSAMAALVNAESFAVPDNIDIDQALKRIAKSPEPIDPKVMSQLLSSCLPLLPLKKKAISIEHINGCLQKLAAASSDQFNTHGGSILQAIKAAKRIIQESAFYMDTDKLDLNALHQILQKYIGSTPAPTSEDLVAIMSELEAIHKYSDKLIQISDTTLLQTFQLLLKQINHEYPDNLEHLWLLTQNISDMLYICGKMVRENPHLYSALAGEGQKSLTDLIDRFAELEEELTKRSAGDIHDKSIQRIIFVLHSSVLLGKSSEHESSKELASIVLKKVPQIAEQNNDNSIFLIRLFAWYTYAHGLTLPEQDILEKDKPESDPKIQIPLFGLLRKKAKNVKLEKLMENSPFRADIAGTMDGIDFIFELDGRSHKRREKRGYDLARDCMMTHAYLRKGKKLVIVREDVTQPKYSKALLENKKTSMEDLLDALVLKLKNAIQAAKDMEDNKTIRATGALLPELAELILDNLPPELTIDAIEKPAETPKQKLETKKKATSIYNPFEPLYEEPSDPSASEDSASVDEASTEATPTPSVTPKTPPSSLTFFKAESTSSNREKKKYQKSSQLPDKEKELSDALLDGTITKEKKEPDSKPSPVGLSEILARAEDPNFKLFLGLNLVQNSKKLRHKPEELKLLKSMGHGFNETLQLEREKLVKFLRLAQQGDAEAQYCMGRALRQYNPDEAFNLLEKAAKQGHVKAQILVAIHYFGGEGKPVNLDKAKEWALLAAKKEHRLAPYILGVFYQYEAHASSKGQPDKALIREAIKCFKLAGANGHTDAQFEVGMWYIQNKNFAQAVKWLKPCVLKKPEAALNLAKCYAGGLGVKKNPKEAFRLYLMADQKDSEVKLQLAIFYIEGKSVKQDVEKGLNLLNYAIAQNNYEASCYLASLYREGKYPKQGITQNIPEAMRLLNLGAAKDHADSQFILGQMHAAQANVEFGMALFFKTTADTTKGIAHNGEALKWLEKAAEKEHPFALHELSVLYKSGLSGVTGPDPAKAKSYLKRALAAGYKPDQSGPFVKPDNKFNSPIHSRSSSRSEIEQTPLPPGVPPECKFQ